VVFNQIALRISAIESVEKSYDNQLGEWCMKIRMVSGIRYTFTFHDAVDNHFDRLTS